MKFHMKYRRRQVKYLGLYGDSRAGQLYDLGVLTRTLLEDFHGFIAEELPGTVCADGEPADKYWDDLAVESLFEDLAWLAEEVDKAVALVQARITDAELKARIAQIRNTTGRTPAEAASANRIADRLERRLRNRLEAAS
jgi:hypothetical protein